MKFASEKLSYYMAQTRYYCVHKVLHADDPPHKLALGIAIGVFVAFLPLIGIQMALSLALAWMCGANKAVGVPLVWISNPLTAVPIYYPGYWLGCRLLNKATIDRWSDLLAFDGGWLSILQQLSSRFSDIVAPLLLGSLIIAIPIGLASYFVSLIGIKYYRLRRWGQLLPPRPETRISKKSMAIVS